eukprot:811690-Pelagomonas_calceolata.AAC.7
MSRDDVLTVTILMAPAVSALAAQSIATAAQSIAAAAQSIATAAQSIATAAQSIATAAQSIVTAASLITLEIGPTKGTQSDQEWTFWVSDDAQHEASEVAFVGFLDASPGGGGSCDVCQRVKWVSSSEAAKAHGGT